MISIVEYFWRWPQCLRSFDLFLYVKPLIFGPFASPTMRAVTAAAPSWAGVASTLSPSTSITGRSVTSSPSRRSTSRRSPSATRYCLPPVWMTAYMRDASSECFSEPGKDSGPAREAQAASFQRALSQRALFQHGLVDDEAAAVAVRARRRERLDQSFRDPLACHLDQTELRDREDLGAGLVAGERLPERFFHRLAILPDLHVDEVDDDDAADVAQSQLARDDLCGFEIVAEDRLLEIRYSDVLPGVDVDDGQSLRALDDDRPARRRPHFAVERLVPLPVDVELLEDGEAFGLRVVVLHPFCELRRDGFDVPVHFFVQGRIVD